MRERPTAVFAGGAPISDLLSEAAAAGRPVLLATEVEAPKPSPAFFAEACRRLERTPAAVLYIDEDDRAVRGARAAGLAAYRWNGPADLPYLRKALGL